MAIFRMERDMGRVCSSIRMGIFTAGSGKRGKKRDVGLMFLSSSVRRRELLIFLIMSLRKAKLKLEELGRRERLLRVNGFSLMELILRELLIITVRKERELGFLKTETRALEFIRRHLDLEKT